MIRRIVNASLEGGFNDLRDLEQFTSTRSMDGSKRVVVIDEAQHLSRDYQDALCGLIERVWSNCSFILTMNDPGKLSAALTSRCTALILPVRQRKLRRSRLRSPHG
jgi:DNA polymerase III delta prime subunit